MNMVQTGRGTTVDKTTPHEGVEMTLRPLEATSFLKVSNLPVFEQQCLLGFEQQCLRLRPAFVCPTSPARRVRCMVPAVCIDLNMQIV
ncbi:uncharacterized protein LOC120646949 isoform X2 [Panicum virgatum]|nr:uncharacterized protein LOC120646949 isoform X2 [Panicum virgatum]